LGQSWTAKGNLYNLFFDQAVYATQFEVASARMKAGDWSMLCPIVPDMSGVLCMATLQMKEAAGKKEFALLGASSGKGTAATTAFMAAGNEEEAAAADT
jgi:hypothetical protein